MGLGLRLFLVVWITLVTLIHTNCDSYSDNSIFGSTILIPASDCEGDEDCEATGDDPQEDAEGNPRRLTLEFEGFWELEIPNGLPNIVMSGTCYPDTFPRNMVRYALYPEGGSAAGSVFSGEDQHCHRGRFSIPVNFPSGYNYNQVYVLEAELFAFDSQNNSYHNPSIARQQVLFKPE